MKKTLQIFITLVFCFSTVAIATAYNPTINETVIPYEVSVMSGDVEMQAEYLGELIGYPQMYEFAIGSGRNLTLKLKQLENETPIPFSLIVVRENNNNGGVSEVGRLKAVDAEWTVTEDSVLGLSFLESKVFSSDIDTGIYRVEVSTPENFGKYLLVVGSEDNEAGYFKTLGDIRAIQKFFDKSVFSLLKSSYYYYPLGILLLITLIWLTRRYRSEIQSKFARKQ